MPLFNKPAYELVEATARILGDWKGGTCNGTGASSLVDTTRTEADDYFQNTVPISRVRIYATTDAAAPQGQERTFSDWVVGTGTGTVTAVWTTANPATGDKYAIMSEYSWDEIFHALNESINLLRGEPILELADEAITSVSGVYEYDIPEGFTHIYRVTLADSEGRFGAPVPPDHYRLVRGLAVPRIHFIRYPDSQQPTGITYTGLWAEDSLASGYPLRVEGFGYQPELLTDFDAVYVDPNWLANQTAAFLAARRITRTDTEPKGYQAKYQVCQAIADKLKPRIIKQFPPDTKRVY